MNFRRARSEPAFCLTVFKIKCHRRMLYTLRNCVSLTCFVTTVGTRGETCLWWLKRSIMGTFLKKWKWEWLSKVVKVGETDETSALELTFAKLYVEQQDVLSVPKMLHTAIAASRIIYAKNLKEFDDVEMHDGDA